MDKRASYPLLIAACLLFLYDAPAAQAGISITFEHAGPIVAGDEQFDGGEVSLEETLDGALLALRINGRQVALYFVDGARPTNVSTLVTRRTESGHELIALRDGRGRETRLRLATGRS